jgi:hypothetical protein
MRRLAEPRWYDFPWAWWLITFVEAVVAGALAGAIVQALELDRRPWEFVVGGVILLVLVVANYRWLRYRRAMDRGRPSNG